MSWETDLATELGIEAKAPTSTGITSKTKKNPSMFLPEEGGTMRTDVKAFVPSEFKADGISFKPKSTTKKESWEDELANELAGTVEEDTATKPTDKTTSFLETMGSTFGDQTPVEGMLGKNISPKPAVETAATLVSGFASFFPALGSMLVPTPEMVKSMPGERNPREEVQGRLDRARSIMEAGTYQPETKEAQGAVRAIGDVLGFIPGKAVDSANYYRNLAKEASKKGNTTTAEAWEVLATATELGGEALNLIILGKAGNFGEFLSKVPANKRALVLSTASKLNKDIETGVVNVAEIREAWKDPANREELVRVYSVGEEASPAAKAAEVIRESGGESQLVKPVTAPVVPDSPIKAVVRDSFENIMKKTTLPAVAEASWETELADMLQNKSTVETNESEMSKSDIGAGVQQTPFEYQNSNQEQVHKEFKNGQYYRYNALEGAGDIFRELSGRKEPDFGYITEKINHIENQINKERTGIHPDDTFETSARENPEAFKKLKEQWSKQPTESDIQKIAVELNKNMLDGDFKSAEKNIEKIKEYFTAKEQIATVSPQELESVKFNGVQKGHKNIPDKMMYTASIDGVQTTFVLEPNETLKDALLRKKLQKVEVDKRFAGSQAQTEASGIISLPARSSEASTERPVDYGQEAESRASIVTPSTEPEPVKKTGALDILKNEAGAITLSKTGFYSKLAEVVSTKMSGKMDAEQMKKMLKNNGVSDAEIESTVGGLKGSVTKQQVLEEIETSGTKFEDVVLGDKQKSLTPLEHRRRIELANLQREFTPEELTEYDRLSELDYNQEYTKTYYEQYSEPGYVPGSYRELFVTAPLKNEKVPTFDEYLIEYPQATVADYNYDSSRGFEKGLLDKLNISTEAKWQDGHSSYSNIQNPIVRLRFNERDVEGNKTLFIEEIQGPSEQNQSKMPEALRKRIYDIGVKKALSYAKENGFDSVAWTSGEMQASRYDLSKHIKELTITTRGTNDYIIAFKDINGRRGEPVIVKNLQELEANIGKDLAKKVVDDTSKVFTDSNKQVMKNLNVRRDDLYNEVKSIRENYNSTKDKRLIELDKEIHEVESDLNKFTHQAKYTDLDLKVGGEGLKRLYDQVIPALMKKYGKEDVENLPIKVTVKSDYKIGIYNGNKFAVYQEGEGVNIAVFNSKVEAQKYLEALQNLDKSNASIVQSIPITSKTPSSFTMYSGLDLSNTLEVLKGLKANAQEAYPYIEDLGKKVYESGKTKFADWFKEIKSILGDLYKKFESIIQDVWSRSIRILNNERGAIGKDIKRHLRDSKKLGDEFLGAISTRLENIDPSIKYRMRKFEYNVGTKVTKLTDRVLPFINLTEHLPKGDKESFDLARKNSNATELNRIVNKYKLGREYHEVKKVLDELRQSAINAGYKSGYLPHYHPREIRDMSGFLDYMYKSDDWSTFDYVIKEKEKKQGALSTEEKVKIINSLLRGYSTEQVTLSKPGQLKARTIKEVTPELNEFYADSNSALLRYIDDVTSAVEAKKLFGKTKSEDTVDYNSTIGSYVLDLIDKELITPSQERELTSILKARFNPVGTSGVVTTFKNLSYADTMGSPTSAIVQIGDITWALYKNGIVSTGKVLPKAVVSKSELTKKDLGIANIAAEFSDKSKSAKLVDTLFKYIGLTKIDAIGKEVLINGAYDKAQKMVKTEKGTAELTKELKPIFEKDTTQVIQDIKDGNITEDVKLYLFNVLADFQPIAKSEMPQKYLTSGNGRIWYMLRTFTLKMFDVFRREAFSKISSKGTRLEGMKNLIKLAALFTVANATADVIQDLLLGRPIELKDSVIDNIIKMSGTTRYTGTKIEKEGVTGALTQVLPPFKLANAVVKDIKTFGDEKGFESVQSIPIFGKLYYWWFGKGARRIKDKVEKEEKVSKKEAKGKETNKLRAFKSSSSNKLRRLND